MTTTDKPIGKETWEALRAVESSLHRALVNQALSLHEYRALFKACLQSHGFCIPEDPMSGHAGGLTLVFAMAVGEGIVRKFLSEGIHFKFRMNGSVLAVHVPSAVARLREEGLLTSRPVEYSKALLRSWEDCSPLVVAVHRPTSFGSRKNKRRAAHLSWKELQALTRGGKHVAG